MSTTRSTTLGNSLKKAGYRLTPQRKAICDLLVQTKEHPSAQMIFDQLGGEDSGLSLATVYNTLDVLTSMGVISVLGAFADGTVRYDADLEPHVNLACLTCNRIVDVESEHIHRIDDEVEQTTGFKVLGARMVYYGICPECQKKSKENNKSEIIQSI